MLVKISLDKFRKDKIFRKYNKAVVSIDGIFLNLKQLLNKNEADDLGTLIMKFYEENPSIFPLKLLGSFQGFIYLGEEDTIILFTDHVGSRPIFYFYDEAENTFIFSSSFPNIVKLRARQLRASGSRAMLGFMVSAFMTRLGARCPSCRCS